MFGEDRNEGGSVFWESNKILADMIERSSSAPAATEGFHQMYNKNNWVRDQLPCTSD